MTLFYRVLEICVCYSYIACCDARTGVIPLLLELYDTCLDI